MNVQCGIMDQAAVAMGKKGYAMALDCATLSMRYVPLELGDARIVVMNTNKKRELADSKYNERFGECRAGLEAIRRVRPLESLCALPAGELDGALRAIDDPVVKKRVRHCVTEQARVEAAVAALEKGDLATLGRLLGESHVSLRDDYEVTGSELDALYEEAIACPGCVGARMTGAGFGGCAIAIVKKEALKEFTKRVGERYRARCGIEASFFACESGDGAGRLT